MTQVALVTGGHTGIGLGIAAALGEAGYRVILMSLDPADAPAVRVALDRLGPGASYIRHDVTDIANHAAALDRIESEAGPVTTFVSNAGVPARVRGDMLSLSPENFDFAMDANLRGAFFLAQEVARRMIRAPGDHYRSLAFVTSVSAAMVSVDRAEYCISKAAAAMMVQLFAARLASHGIGVFELRPGIIETGMTTAVKDAYTARIEAGLVPAGRWGQPPDIGNVVVPLARGQFAFATGTTIAVDGGLSIPRL